VKEYIAAFFVAAILFSVSPAFAQQEKSPADKYQNNPLVYAELAKAPEKARAKRNPLETEPEAVAAGRILFEQHCAECHGATAEGGKKGPSLRAAEVQGAAPGAIFWILTNGVVRKGMPVWSKLPEPQRWQLVSYLKSLGVIPAKPLETKPGNPPPISSTDSPSPCR
jgi:mono/diheme cytochrome c family protein